jgi:hypothetical protein
MQCNAAQDAHALTCAHGAEAVDSSRSGWPHCGTVGGTNTDTSTARRMCSRRGCNQPVKKSTAKYCSVQCCTIDPERRERMRESARRASRRVLPMQRQLALGFAETHNPEAEIARLCEGREDVPRGMSHLAG